MPLPTIVIVPGSWHTAVHWGPMRAYLDENGYKSVAVTLPSVIQNDGDEIPTTLDPDIQAVRTAVRQELDKGSNVVVVAHSSGGLSAMSALDGLDQGSRNKTGQSTYVSGIACIAAFVLPPGVSVLSESGVEVEDKHDIKGDLLFIGERHGGATHWFYEDLPAEEAEKWGGLLKPMAWKVNTDKTRSAAYEIIPTRYLACTRDAALPFEAQKASIAAASARGLPITIEEIDAGHSPYLSKVEETGRFIRKSAGESV